MSMRRQALFWGIGIIVFFVLVWLLSAILLPFVAGMALAYFLDPVADRLERHGMGRSPAAGLVVVGTCAAVLGVFLLIEPLLADQIVKFVDALPGYIAAIREKLGPLFHRLQHAAAAGGAQADVKEAVGNAGKEALGTLTNLLVWLLGGGLAVFNLISLLLITPVVFFYLLRDWDKIVAKIDSWLPRDHAATIRQQASEVDRVLAGFVRGQSTMCLIQAIYYSVGLTVIGLQFGLVIGIVTGVLTFIPFVGAITGFALALGVGLAQFGLDWMMLALIVGVMSLGQILEGYVLQPLLLGRSVGLHEVWVIFALLAGGALFGFVGVLIALPAFAVIGVLARFALGRYLDSRMYSGTGGGEGAA
jgi:predicted PurR-regulated permease PerM